MNENNQVESEKNSSTASRFHVFPLVKINGRKNQSVKNFRWVFKTALPWCSHSVSPLEFPFSSMGCKPERSSKPKNSWQQIFLGHNKQVRGELTCINSGGRKHFRLYHNGQPMNLVTGHKALRPFSNWNFSTKTYRASLTRRLDRIVKFILLYF